MFGIGSLLTTFRVRALSLLVIVPVLNRRAARRLEARSGGQLVELGRGDAITQLKIDLDGLREQLRATEKDLAASATAARETERALADKESELVGLKGALDERSMQEDVQKTEIVTLKMQVEALQGRLAQAREAAKAAEECRDVAVRVLSEKESEMSTLATALDERSTQEDAQKTEIAALRTQLLQAGEAAKAAEERRDVAVRALSEKESELARLTSALNQRSVMVDSQKGEITTLTTQIQMLKERVTQTGEETRAMEDRHNAAVRALSGKESELARLTNALNERSGLVDSQNGEIAALTTQIQTLKERLTQVGEEARAMEERGDAANCALSEKESQLASLTHALNERSLLVDTQKVENAALRMQVRALNDHLIQAGKEARALEECRDVEHNELQAAMQNLMAEREKFESFHRHVVNLVQQLTAQHNEDRALDQRAREDLENRLVQQSRLLDESESELTHLRGEIEIARKAEDDLRIAIIEIDGHANAAIQSLNAEKAQLQAALDRAIGERARLVHELADLKRRRADETRAAEQLDNLSDIAAERARRSA